MNATPHLGGKEIRGNEHRFQWEETKPSEEKEVILEELLGPKIAYWRNIRNILLWESSQTIFSSPVVFID